MTHSQKCVHAVLSSLRSIRTVRPLNGDAVVARGLSHWTLVQPSDGSVIVTTGIPLPRVARASFDAVLSRLADSAAIGQSTIESGVLISKATFSLPNTSPLAEKRITSVVRAMHGQAIELVKAVRIALAFPGIEHADVALLPSAERLENEDRVSDDLWVRLSKSLSADGKVVGQPEDQTLG